jgi:hypothetical protein
MRCLALTLAAAGPARGLRPSAAAALFQVDLDSGRVMRATFGLVID